MRIMRNIGEINKKVNIEYQENWDNNRPKWEYRVNRQCWGSRKTKEKQENKENGKIIVSVGRSPFRYKK